MLVKSKLLIQKEYLFAGLDKAFKHGTIKQLGGTVILKGTQLAAQCMNTCKKSPVFIWQDKC